jgi:hypothetical protein
MPSPKKRSVGQGRSASPGSYWRDEEGQAVSPIRSREFSGHTRFNFDVLIFVDNFLCYSEDRRDQEDLMVVVRDVFRLKFGQSKEAVALWKEAAASLRTSGYGAIDVRLLTDLVGAPYYTVILESTFNSVAEWEKAHLAARDNAPWKALYGKIVPFTETGHREILSVVA